MLRPETSELSIEELRTVQLDVLAEFDRICRAHGLTYYAAFGTLLGAVRHGGYIPWDDDIDVMMPRADYDRLHDIFQTAAPQHVSLSSPRTRADWQFPFAKIGDERTQLWEPLENPLPLAVNVDLFPVDALPSGRLTCWLQSRLLTMLRWAVELRYIAAERGRGWHHPWTITLGKPLLRLIPLRLLVGALTRLAHPGPWPGDRVGMRVGSSNWSVPAGDLGSPIEVEFEHLRLLAPANPEAVLTAVYGDFRQLPPDAEQTSHHAFTAAWRSG